jgi:hypothetical protein
MLGRFRFPVRFAVGWTWVISERFYPPPLGEHPHDRPGVLRDAGAVFVEDASLACHAGGAIFPWAQTMLRYILWVVGLLTLAALLCVALGWVPWSTWLADHDYDRVRVGMTADEVEAAIGPQVSMILPPQRLSTLGPECQRQKGMKLSQVRAAETQSPFFSEMQVVLRTLDDRSTLGIAFQRERVVGCYVFKGKR